MKQTAILFPPEKAAAIWDELAAKTPLIHCLTNGVAKNFTANILLAAGASPAMVEAEEECADFTAVAANLLINIGTINARTANAMRIAARVAHENHKPWVLDPVAVGDLLRFRSDLARELLQFQPAVIRGNASEILWLAGEKADQRGADSLSRSDDALTLQAAAALARAQNCVVVVTGEKDFITDGEQLFFTQGGDVRMTKITATGCALSALVTAFCAVSTTPIEGASAAAAVMKLAGSYAADCQGMGTMVTRLLDGLTYDFAVTMRK